MADLYPGIDLAARLERAYRLKPPHDWQEALSRLHRLDRYGESVLHEAAHALVAWHSPTCIAVFGTSVRSEDKCVTTVYSPLTEHPSVLWDDMAYNLASMVLLAQVMPGHRPEGAQLDASTALFCATRLWAAPKTRHQPPPWTQFNDVPVPDIPAVMPLRVLPEQLPYLRIGWRRALTLMAAHAGRLRLLCGVLSRFGALNILDLRLLLGRRALVTPLVSLIAYFS